MKLPRPDEVIVESVVAFKDGEPIPFVRLTLLDPDEQRDIYLDPADARKVGLDLIGGAHQSVADAELRSIAKNAGLDGDGLLHLFRERTSKELP